jgi:hypothetical protein
MSDPVDELVGAAEEVVMAFSTHIFFLLWWFLVSKAYNDVKQWHQGELAICAQGRLHVLQSHRRRFPTNETRLVELYSCIGRIHGQHVGKDHLHDGRIQRGWLPEVDPRKRRELFHRTNIVSQTDFRFSFERLTQRPSVTTHTRQVYPES